MSRACEEEVERCRVSGRKDDELGRVVKNGEDRKRLVIQWILVTAM